MQYIKATYGKVNVILILIVLLMMIIVYTKWNDTLRKSTLQISHMDTEVILMKRLVPNNRNIFFIETSCVFKNNESPDGLKLNSRQTCAIYSTAKMNPTRHIILYHSCPLHPEFYERSHKSGQLLLQLPNVYVFHAKYEDLLRGTIVETIIDGELQQSLHVLEHSADVLRLVLVYKYGGAYMDLDFISLKSLDSLANNFVGKQTPGKEMELSNAVFQFEFQGQGNEFVKDMLMDVAYSYNGQSWGGNGPELFQRNFIKFCNITQNVPPTEASTKSCGISVYNETIFYPLHYSNWKQYFLPKEGKKIRDQIKDSLAVHFYNFLSKNEPVVIGEHTAYELLAGEYCREILESSGDLF